MSTQPLLSLKELKPNLPRSHKVLVTTSNPLATPLQANNFPVELLTSYTQRRNQPTRKGFAALMTRRLACRRRSLRLPLAPFF